VYKNTAIMMKYEIGRIEPTDIRGQFGEIQQSWVDAGEESPYLQLTPRFGTSPGQFSSLRSVSPEPLAVLLTRA
jgi:hypothetical protein